jgi:transketolase|tara:strand:+ start:94 stop:915 length:822 start_codon:yes stop_codon:yes gene_type:complete
MMADSNAFDSAAARRRCLKYRRRILDISQVVSALHIAPAYSCLEIVDAVYHGLLRRGGASPDTFLMSKGHGCVAQYVVLEDLGVLLEEDIAQYCTSQGRLGAHPDYGVPGIEASTGSLGHGMGIAVGMAYADRLLGDERRVFVVLSDGEMQEGSTWETMMMAANLGLSNIVALLDLNDRQSLGQTSKTHPAFYPVDEKAEAFGWEVAEVNGHDADALTRAFWQRAGDKPFFLVCRTIKGKGVRFMENVPIWHYRSPTPDEYQEAIDNLVEIGE